ncbi:hypothetical protein GCM10010524_08690 [Streptomyces mexicanus]
MAAGRSGGRPAAIVNGVLAEARQMRREAPFPHPLTNLGDDDVSRQVRAEEHRGETNGAAP